MVIGEKAQAAKEKLIQAQLGNKIQGMFAGIKAKAANVTANQAASSAPAGEADGEASKEEVKEGEEKPALWDFKVNK